MPITGLNRAVILPQLGSVPIDKQINACLQYVCRQGTPLAAIGRPERPEDVIATIREGSADTVLVAYGGRWLVDDVARAGGRVVAVHPKPHVVKPRSILAAAGELIRRLAGRGKTAHEIAEFMGESTCDIRDVLREIE